MHFHEGLDQRQPDPQSALGAGQPPRLDDFVTGLEMELRLRPVVFDRAELETWAADVWSLGEDDPDMIRWAETFLGSQQEAAGA
jgi:hypothetical protein